MAPASYNLWAQPVIIFGPSHLQSLGPASYNLWAQLAVDLVLVSGLSAGRAALRTLRLLLGRRVVCARVGAPRYTPLHVPVHLHGLRHQLGQQHLGLFVLHRGLQLTGEPGQLDGQLAVRWRFSREVLRSVHGLVHGLVRALRGGLVLPPGVNGPVHEAGGAHVVLFVQLQHPQQLGAGVSGSLVAVDAHPRLLWPARPCGGRRVQNDGRGGVRRAREGEVGARLRGGGQQLFAMYGYADAQDSYHL